MQRKNDGNVVVFFISDGEITNDDRLKSFDGAKNILMEAQCWGTAQRKAATCM